MPSRWPFFFALQLAFLSHCRHRPSPLQALLTVSCPPNCDLLHRVPAYGWSLASQLTNCCPSHFAAADMQKLCAPTSMPMFSRKTLLTQCQWHAAALHEPKTRSATIEHKITQRRSSQERTQRGTSLTGVWCVGHNAINIQMTHPLHDVNLRRHVFSQHLATIRFSHVCAIKCVTAGVPTA